MTWKDDDQWSRTFNDFGALSDTLCKNWSICWDVSVWSGCGIYGSEGLALNIEYSRHDARILLARHNTSIGSITWAWRASLPALGPRGKSPTADHTFYTLYFLDPTVTRGHSVHPISHATHLQIIVLRWYPHFVSVILLSTHLPLTKDHYSESCCHWQLPNLWALP